MPDTLGPSPKEMSITDAESKESAGLETTLESDAEHSAPETTAELRELRKETDARDKKEEARVRAELAANPASEPRTDLQIISREKKTRTHTSNNRIKR